MGKIGNQLLIQDSFILSLFDFVKAKVNKILPCFSLCVKPMMFIGFNFFFFLSVLNPIDYTKADLVCPESCVNG